jgi:hypothetical protein
MSWYGFAPYVSVAQRRANAARYRTAFASAGLSEVVLPVEAPDRTHIYNQFVIRVPNRDGLKAKLDAAGIGGALEARLQLGAQALELGVGEVDAGRAGIRTIGYNFSIASVWGRDTQPVARGGALSVGYHDPVQPPIPKGMVWNMVYDKNAPPGTVPPATPEQLWQRLKDFLDALLPVAEEVGVTLAAHPDDPPMPTIRGRK